MKNTEKKLAGLPLYQQKQMIQTLLESPEAIKTFEELSRKKNQSIEISHQKAKAILVELTSDYSPKFLGVSYWIIKAVEKFMFERIQTYGHELEEIRSLTDNGKIIFFLPNHKSHMDYLLLSYILYNHRIAPPHIAAGVNLAFFPFDTLFRRTGAYFIRRKIAGNFLYTKLLQIYFEWMLREKISQEFYMEGGRSRDGKIREAQSGIFTLFVEQIQKLGLEDQVYLVPTAITYDQLPEMAGLMNELKGAEKEKESIFSLLSSISILFTNHRNVHVQFGKPISLKDQLTSDFSKKDFQVLSHKISSNIQKQKTLTDSSLIALALLSHNQQVDENTLREQIGILIQILKPCIQCVSEDFLNIEKNWDLTISTFEKLNWFEKNGSTLRINNEKRMEMNYYKNDLLPILVPYLLSGETLIQDIIRHEYPYAIHEVKKTIEKNFLAQCLTPILSLFYEVLEQIKPENLPNLLSKEIQKQILESIKSNKNFNFPEVITSEAIRSACLFFHQHEGQLKEVETPNDWKKILLTQIKQ